MSDVFCRLPPIPVFGSNPGVGRPPGSSTDGVYVRDPNNPISAGSSSPGASPISVRGSSGQGSPQPWPLPSGTNVKEPSLRNTGGTGDSPHLGRCISCRLKTNSQRQPSERL